jgi:hypothetical protein
MYAFGTVMAVNGWAKGKVCILGRLIYHHQNAIVLFRGGQTFYEIH